MEACILCVYAGAPIKMGFTSPLLSFHIGEKQKVGRDHLTVKAVISFSSLHLVHQDSQLEDGCHQLYL